MKKILISIFLILILALTVSACSNDSHRSQDETTALESASMVDNVYVDTDHDPGFGYKLCYMSKNLTGNVGIVDSAGNIVIEPSYVSAFPIRKDRFVVEKTVDNSKHAALVDENKNFLVPFFRGVIRQTGVLAPEGTPPILVIEPLYGKIRFVNTDGEQIIPLEFDSASIHQYNGFFFGSKNTEAGETLYVYDYNGKELCVLNNGDYAELRNCGNKL